MSMERFASGDHRYDREPHRALVSPAEQMRSRMKQRVSRVLERAYNDCDTQEQHIAALPWFEQLGERLDGLTESIYRLAKSETADEFIHLDDGLQNLKPEGPVWDASLEEAYNGYLADGINEALTSLAPEEAELNGFDKIYFLPWQLKLLLEQRNDVELHPDGTAQLILETRIPGLAVEYLYRSGENLPKRTIFGRSESTTPPSSR